MKYHAKVEYAEKHYYWNWTKENIIDSLLIPFINGQVVLANNYDSKILLNLKNVSKIAFYRTKEKLEATSDKSIIEQMEETHFIDNECTEKLIQETRLNLSSPQSLSLLQKSFAPTENQAFVIMKFGDKMLDSAYEGVIIPTFKEHGIDVIRVDEIQDSGKISDQILDLISKSRFVISDLTGSRPNCYYETGFSHALGKEIILACHSSEKIHFDLAGYRFIVWETESDYRKQLKARVKKLIEKNAT
jgi:hypothetical protein